MPQGVQIPKNAILIAGTPIVQEMEVQTATNVKPGRLVEPGTAAYQCVVCTAINKAIGVVDVDPVKTRQTYSAGAIQTGPDNATEYEAGDQVRILRGDIVVLLVAKSGETINVGTLVAPTDGGMVIAEVVSGSNIGYAVTAKPTNGGNDNEWIAVKLTKL